MHCESQEPLLVSVVAFQGTIVFPVWCDGSDSVCFLGAGFLGRVVSTLTNCSLTNCFSVSHHVTTVTDCSTITNYNCV